MPQNGSGNYEYPPGTQGAPDQTIESEAYNTFIDDLIVNDLNIARPIHRGGTGATAADVALTNLGAEKAQQLVSNYDTHVWKSGSFYSGGSATAQPVAASVVGTCLIFSDDWITLEAVNVSNGVQYGRQKVSGVWGAWTELTSSVAAADARYVNVSGDTMTGPFTVSTADPFVFINKGAGSHSVIIQGQANSLPRWNIMPGDYAPESGGNAGSDFSIQRKADDGAHLGVPFSISRASGHILLEAEPVAGLHVATKNYADTKLPLAGGTITGSLGVNGGLTVGGAVTAASVTTSGNIVGGDIMAARSATSGYYFFGNSGSKYLGYDGSTFLLIGAPLNFGASGSTYIMSDNTNLFARVALGGSLYVSNAVNGVAATLECGQLNAGVSVNSGGGIQGAGYKCRQGTAGGFGANSFNFFWTGALMEVWVDGYNPGTIAYNSDYRIKKDVVDLDSKWDVVKALRPIKYTQAEFTPPAQKAYIAKEVLKSRKEAEDDPSIKPREIDTGPTYVADNVERWGFVAHELQATMIESASTGVKDAPDVVQSPNPWTIIAALTKVVQELQARVEALEAA